MPGLVSAVNDVLCINIKKIDGKFKTYYGVQMINDITFCEWCLEGKTDTNSNYSYYDCCGDNELISGYTTVSLEVCFNTNYPFTNLAPKVPQVVCDTSIMTRCCEVELAYDSLDYVNACGALPNIYFLSVPCIISKCDLVYAFGIYTDDSCTTLAPDGYYSDGFVYGSVSGGIYTYGSVC